MEGLELDTNLSFYKRLQLHLWTIIIMILLVIKVYLFNYFVNQPLSKGFIITTIGLILFILSFSYLFNQKGQRIYLFIVNAGLTILILTDVLYFSYYRSPISVYTFLQVKNLSGLQDSILFLFEWQYVLFLLDLMLLPFLSRIVFSEQQKNHRKSLRLFFVFLISGLLIVSAKPLKNIYLDEKDPFKRYDVQNTIMLYGVLGYHVLDIGYFFNDLNMELSKKQEKQIDTWFAAKVKDAAEFEEHPEVQAYHSAGKGKNLIMIQVESLQNFVINQKVEGQEITPNLNKILKNSLYFPNIYPQTVEGNSSDAEFLVNTSLYPLKKGPVFFRYPYNTYYSIGEMLKERGYKTFAVHADNATFWNRDKMYPNIGIDKYYAVDHFKMDEEIGMGLSDNSMFRQSMEFIDNTVRPFYSFYVTLSNHVPFVLPENEKLLKLTGELGTSHVGNYLQSVRYTDEAIGSFLKLLDARNLLDDSIIVLYGDHNGLFQGDKAGVEKVLAREALSDEKWLRKYTPIPLIIYKPTMEGKMFDTVGGQIDIFPTVASIMGIDLTKYSGVTMGNNLLGQENGTVILPKGDYLKSGIVITSEGVETLSEEHNLTLDVSDLIIRGNYFELN